MAIKHMLSAIAAAALFHGAVFGQTTYSQAAIDNGEALADLSKKAKDAAIARLPATGTGCTKENVRVRKEWRRIPGEERIAFTDAMQCLQKTPAVYTDTAGAKSAYDDFAVLHYHKTPYVHNSATFLLFHRYYIYTIEEALRTKCGFNGTFPYWEWGLDVGGVAKSPVFDGSPTSMGGDGEYIPGHQPSFFGIPAGTGGGCVKSGPFSNFTVNMGPSTGRANPLAHNPRCLKRDLNPNVTARWASIRNTTDTILDAPNIELFQAIIQGDSRYPESRGLGLAVHGGGHYSIGGDPGGDFYFSPLEPGFWLHHGQIDRLYFVWQNQDWANRQNIAGTGTMMNQPPSAVVKIEELMEMGPLNAARSLKELIDTAGGAPMCYVYE